MSQEEQIQALKKRLQQTQDQEKTLKDILGLTKTNVLKNDVITSKLVNLEKTMALHKTETEIRIRPLEEDLSRKKRRFDITMIVLVVFMVVIGVVFITKYLLPFVL